MISRYSVARYLVDGLETSRARRVNEVAAWLIAGHKADTANLITRDVAKLLAQRGYVAAKVVTARPLAKTVATDIENYIKKLTGADTVELEEIVDSSAVGGLKIELPGAELDATVRTKLKDFVTEMAK